jgi:hypothetical protein
VVQHTVKGEIRKAKLVKYENDILRVTYRSCLPRDTEPFEKVAFPIAVDVYIPERDLVLPG